MDINKLSIIIPVYNEVNTLEKILKNIEQVNTEGIKKEIILVDDGSTDGTRELLSRLETLNIYKISYHDKNMGKGAAIRTGLKLITGEIVIIQDADLEYDPGDYLKLLVPFKENNADVVYGSRFADSENKNTFGLLQKLGNMSLTLLTNLLYGSNITDMETCYKVFRYDVIKNINIKSNRFDFEPEISAKIMKNKYKIVEISIKYNKRSYHEGKKIKFFKDGTIALLTLLRYRIID